MILLAFLDLVIYTGHLSPQENPLLEQVRKSSNAYRKEREEYFIRKFNTVERGMNRKYYKDKEVVGRF